MKTRSCIVCSLVMDVPLNSGRKYCQECMNKRRAEKAQQQYTEYIKDGRVTQYRIIMKERQRERLKDDAYRLVTRAKNRARCKSVECSITPKDLQIPDKCPALGTEFKYGTEYAMSIDAINPKKGYTADNVQVLSMKANAMKNSASREELISFAKWVLANYG